MRLYRIVIILSISFLVLALVFPYLSSSRFLFDFNNDKNFSIDQDEYTLAENYTWAYDPNDNLKYLGQHTETDSDTDTEEYYSVYSLNGRWSKDYLGTRTMGLFPTTEDVYIRNGSDEPIMFMDIQESSDPISINDVTFEPKQLIEAIRTCEPENYDAEKYENTLKKTVFLYVGNKTLIRCSCKLLYDSEADEYYIVRYDIKDSCYYMHNVP